MKSLIWISALSLVFISALIQKVASDLPHCSLTTAIIAQVQRLDLDTDEIQLTTSVQVALNVRETACFRIYFDESAENLGENSSDSSSIYYQYNGSLLYTFTYQSLEQQYPVKSQYEFALPVLAGNCVCDCPGGEDHCNGAHEHKNCSLQNDSMGICVTTYHPHQPTTGCFSDTSDGELCCQVKLKNLHFSFFFFHSFFWLIPVKVSKNKARKNFEHSYLTSYLFIPFFYSLTHFFAQSYKNFQEQ